MEIMIPSDISPDVRSNAERHVFSWFKEAPDTEDWIVLHSLGITNHNKLIYGEVDFFVLVPNWGIFALEVKGGRVQKKRESGLLPINMIIQIAGLKVRLIRLGMVFTV